MSFANIQLVVWYLFTAMIKLLFPCVDITGAGKCSFKKYPKKYFDVQNCKNF